MAPPPHAMRVQYRAGPPTAGQHQVCPRALEVRVAAVPDRVIRAAWLGTDAGDLTALENPAAVDVIRALGQAAGR